MEIYYEKKRKEQEEKDKRDYTKKLINNLNKMQEKKVNMIPIPYFSFKIKT